jgi:transposase
LRQWDLNGQSADARLAAREKLSSPIIEALKPKFQKQLSLISMGFTLATDIPYASSHWAGLAVRVQGQRC